jgi:hypothetical protein
MSPHYRARRTLSLVAIASVTLAGCAMGGQNDQAVEEDVVEEVDTAPVELEELVFSLPSSCLNILPSEALDKLTSGEVDLLRGPGSGSADSVYPEGMSPQEERGGISCLFGNLDETITYTVSVAPMTQATRAEVIDGLLAQQLNPGQTLDGALTYWIQGDEATVPAIYNALYDDAWYEVLIFPGGRLAYEESETLVSMMRSHTTK